MRSIAELETMFAGLGIDCQNIEFYNSPAFQSAEKRDPNFLAAYGEYVQAKTFDADYLTRARIAVPKVAAFLRRELVRDGRLGACIDASHAMMKILEKLGIWCYFSGGSLTIEFAPEMKLPTRYWAHFFEPPPNAGTPVGHAWLSAPPFKVVDITIGRQPNTERIASHLPDLVVEYEVGEVEGVSLEDMLDSSLREKMAKQGYPVPTIHELMKQRPEVAQMLRTFRPFCVQNGKTTLKYFPCCAGALEEKFEVARTQCFSGRTYQQLFDDLMSEVGSEISLH